VATLRERLINSGSGSPGRRAASCCACRAPVPGSTLAAFSAKQIALHETFVTSEELKVISRPTFDLQLVSRP
jgi:hypothetical protein